MEKTKTRVVVAMSGGVDSSVTAALLKDEGYDVVGISMQVWDHSRAGDEAERFGSCCSLDDIHDARRVAEHLQIPFYVVNFEEEFRRLVIDDFVEEYFRGRTPNPCVRCNQWIKFDLLLNKAGQLNADYLATGHYARIEQDPAAGGLRLLTGVDRRKDQSYFLFTLTQEQLRRTLFPLGGMTKGEVRSLAARYGLRVADKVESQEICFIPDDDYAGFLESERGAGLMAGEIVDRNGRVLGRHDGTYRYTVGQRKGLGIAHPHPLYVLRVDPERRQVVVGGVDELQAEGLIAAGMNWIPGAPPAPFDAACKIRYRHRPVPCRVEPLPGHRAAIRFLEPEKSVTPGQAVVVYDGERVVGGGWIE